MRPTVLYIFVSSTWLDLQPERAAVEAALQRLRETKFVGMEYFGSRDEDTRHASLDEVDRSQVYVGIFGGRYGSGITEAEYRRARELGLPCRIYFKDEAVIPMEGRETDPEKATRLAALKAELLLHHTVSTFTTPDDLAARVIADLHRWLFDQYLNRVFVGNYERLRDVYIPPWSVFERVRLDRFVGRKWLTAEVNSFLRDNDRGYFVLEAGAGLGKTTFLAHLAWKQGYLHHFVELAPGPDGIAPGLKNLAAQLVRAWELNPYSVDEVLPDAATRPDFLQNLLFEAARRRDEANPGEKIILVVDALDEAGTPYGQNVLGLPRVLPKGVYFIVSQRPVAVPLRVEGPHCVFRLEAEGEANLADMKAYLEAAATWPGVTQALAERKYTSAQFVETLLRKCRGVWIYLHYVVGEIERGERSPLDLETLPNDVWQYYAQYWRRWQERDEAAWYGEHLPLLGTLAAAQEALTLPQLCALARVTERPGLGRLLREDWRSFLAVDDVEDSPRYRLYHASLREFLDGRTDLTRLEEAERSLAEELAKATHHAHARIADRYLNAWGGLEAVWRGLRRPERRDIDGRYGLRHLTTHLERAGRATDLHRLLQLEWVQEEEVSIYRVFSSL